MKKKLSLLLAIVIVMAIFAGCAAKTEPQTEEPTTEVTEAPKATAEPTEELKEAAFPVEIVDYNGNTVVIKEEPQTIVSLSPANTELLFTLGVGDKVVGVTEYCNYPEASASVDKVGDFNGPNVEMVLEKMPDLIVSGGYMHEDVQTAFEEAGITVLPIESASFSNVYTNIEAIAKATGVGEEGEAIVAKMKEDVATIEAKAKDIEPKKVFYIVDATGDEIWTAGQGTFIDEIISLVGGENVAQGDAWMTISTEAIIEANPDIIIMPPFSGDLAKFTDDAVYAEVSAVKNGQCILLEDADIISRGTPRLIQGIEMMGKVIQPEIFE